MRHKGHGSCKGPYIIHGLLSKTLFTYLFKHVFVSRFTIENLSHWEFLIKRLLNEVNGGRIKTGNNEEQRRMFVRHREEERCYWCSI